MKVKQQQQHLLPRGSWDFHLTSSSSCCSHQTLRPLAPKLDTTAPASLPPPPPPPAAAHEAVGGSSSSSNTRWNPTEEQIGMLEMLYSRGMRTPNSHQIENIALQLSKFGKIQPKNVFYWFQNHKARERQKLKRLSTSTTTMPTSFFTFHHQTSEEKTGSEEATATTTTTSKKKCTNWTFHKLETSRRLSRALSTNSLQAELEINNDDHANQVGFKKTLQLFPLHPEPTKLD